MKFSVVVPFRNSERFLDGCIRSLLDQSYPADHYEILLVDNGSSDGSVALARRYPAVRLLHQPKIGAYAARNLGLDHAAGEIIAFTDSDCEADPHWLAAFERAFSDPEIGVALGRRAYPVAAGPLKWLEAFEHHKTAWSFARADGASYYGYTNNLAARVALFEEVGRFAEIRRGADTLWVQAVVGRRSPRAVGFAPDALIHHREITSLASYYRKRWIYGRSGRRNQDPDHTGGRLTVADRLETYRRTIAAEGYGPAVAAALVLLLMIRALCSGLAAGLPAPPGRISPQGESHLER